MAGISRKMQTLSRPRPRAKKAKTRAASESPSKSPSPPPLKREAPPPRSQLSSQEIREAHFNQRPNQGSHNNGRGATSLVKTLRDSASSASAASSSSSKKGRQNNRSDVSARELVSLSQPLSAVTGKRRNLKPDSAFKSDDEDDESSSSSDDSGHDGNYAEPKAKAATRKQSKQQPKAAKTAIPSSSAPAASSSSTSRSKASKKEILTGSWLDDLPGPSTLQNTSVPPEELERFLSSSKRLFDNLAKGSAKLESRTAKYPIRAAGLEQCPFCERPLPDRPSAALLEAVQGLLDLAHKEKRTLEQEEHERACQRHKNEIIISDGKERGWPVSLDVNKLRRRIASPAMCRLIEARMAEPEKSDWFVQERKIRSQSGFWLDSIDGQMQTMEEQQAGYYGEIGAHHIREQLTEQLITVPSKSELDLSALARRHDSPIEPMTALQFLERVIFPEVVCALIREDHDGKKGTVMSITEARRIRDQSNEYGALKFPQDPYDDDSDDDSDAGNANDDAFVAVSGPFKQATTADLDEIIGRDSSPEVYEASGTSTRGTARHAIGVLDTSPSRPRKGTAKRLSQAAPAGPISVSSSSTAPSQRTQTQARPRPRARASCGAKASETPHKPSIGTREHSNDGADVGDAPSSSLPELLDISQTKAKSQVIEPSTQDSMSSPHLPATVLESITVEGESALPPPSPIGEHLSRKRARVQS